MKIMLDQNLYLISVNTDSAVSEVIVEDEMSYVEDEMGYVEEDIYGEVVSPKDPLLSKVPFVVGVTSFTLIISVVLGLLLAKKKIKKGIELYED